ncbi:MAG TPA: PEP-utilizing enzyme [Chloroflexia bacterium]|nr:PEP-utilizing enzyme [Chloroflexia bacterium]
MLTHAPPAPIPPPADFPVTWPHPDDAGQHWLCNREHFPQPITPMAFSLIDRLQAAGQQRVAARYPDAIVARPCRRINTYFYAGLVRFDGPSTVLAARVAGSQAAIHAVMWRLAEVWTTEWRPELEAHLAAWDAFDLPGASLPALHAHLDATLTRGARLWELHFLLAAPVWTALHEFTELYTNLFAPATPLDAYELLAGFDNKTLELGRALWRLSQQARRHPAVAAILTTPGADVLGLLAQSAAGQDFWRALRTFLDVYGRRSNLWDWGYPSWIEDPAPVLANLRHYLTQPDRDLDAEEATAVAARERAVAAARSRLQGYPQPAVAQFERLLPVAQTALRISEDHNFYIDFSGMYRVRQVIHEFGRRFQAAGLLAASADVFYLTLDELRVTAAARHRLDRRDLAAARRAEMAYWAGITPPNELGTPGPADLPLATPAAQRQARLFLSPAHPPAAPGIIQGQAGAPGRVWGRACVLGSLADADKLRPGDVLVTATTAPPWTPLFRTAAAIVTDMGGPLTHGAIVAREYGIPAVVGARTATAQIADGQWLEVDGDAGVVRILPGR